MSETKRPKVQVAYYQNHFGDIYGAFFSENEQTVDSLDNFRCYPFEETFDYMQSMESQLAALKKENEMLNADVESIAKQSVGEVAALLSENERLEARVAELEHAANEWADACINGLQHLKNIRDGISLASAVIPNMEQCIEHCQLVWDAAPKESANEG